MHHPISKCVVDFSALPGAKLRLGFHKELKSLRKVALRLGYLSGHHWQIRPDATKKLLNKKIAIDDLEERDVIYNLQQKGVDMKIGLDIASLALKRMVTQMILVSGDGDFVPAAKLARREGIDFILDPMWAGAGEQLLEHIDGLKSTAPKPTTYPA